MTSPPFPSSPKASTLPPTPTTNLIIRFSTTPPLPDLTISQPSPSTTPIAALKQAIRASLPSPLSTHGLRLISSGRLLADASSVSSALRLAPDEGKGKGRVAPGAGGTGASTGLRGQAPIYIHASLTPSPLSPALLAAEVSLATIPLAPVPLTTSMYTTTTPFSDPNSTITTPTPATNPTNPSSHLPLPSPHPTTTPRPLGFDRLLPTLPASEIASLRAQHRALVAQRHTPDTMPDASALRLMEEAWLDSGAGPHNPAHHPGPGATPGGAGGGGPGGGAGADDEDDASAALRDALAGAVAGFFWPLGAAAWALREEGVWSRRRQVAVLAGFFVNLGFGVLRLLGPGEGGF